MAEKILDDMIELAVTADLSFIVSITMAENSTFEGRLVRYIVANLIAILSLFFSVIFESLIVWIPSFLLILDVIIWCFVELRRHERDV